MEYLRLFRRGGAVTIDKETVALLLLGSVMGAILAAIASTFLWGWMHTDVVLQGAMLGYLGACAVSSFNVALRTEDENARHLG